MAKAAKTRTCVVCRESFDKQDLLRFVVDPNNDIMLDVYAKAPARGSYICQNQACLDKAIGKSVIVKMLKANKVENFKENTLKSLLNKLSSALLMLKKSQRLVLGTDNVIDLIKANKCVYVLFAEDISSKSKTKIEHYLEKNTVKSTSLLTKDELSDYTGLANCTVLAFQKCSLTDSFIQTVNFYKKVLNTWKILKKV